MTNGEKHIEKLLSWYKEAVTEDGVCYLTCDDKNTLAYALKYCKHYEDIKKDIDTWMLREELSSSENPNKSEIPTSSTTENDLGVDAVSRKELLKIYEYRFSELQKLKHLKDNKGAEDRQMGVNYCINILKELPPVTPIRPKGHWIDHSDEGYVECPKCGSATNCDSNINDLHFCFSCGAEMGVKE
jgi:hypothetical protein